MEVTSSSLKYCLSLLSLSYLFPLTPYPNIPGSYLIDRIGQASMPRENAPAGCVCVCQWQVRGIGNDRRLKRL